ncbi:hypothetical protein EUX98_g1891 [Antrodiella citrinella]|uniref:Uncharacterized protein n=1 Tax=Antrodiella citrinella TaxID=2447956 RepID=A0A4S4N385_9APHY|nr:hypothetical protein EUX98_g1891 [Antrodiella citrinella]
MGRSLPKITLTNLSLSLLCLSVAFKLTLTIWLRKYDSPGADAYSYVGVDYPETWPIDVPKVLLASDASHRYQMDTADGAAEWASLTPGNGTVFLGEERRPYTISMMHQLRCMNIIRESILEDRSVPETSQPSDLARHCLNYLKQMMLCRADTYMESFWYDNSDGPIDLWSMYECKDWGAVHEAVKKNQRDYELWDERR